MNPRVEAGFSGDVLELLLGVDVVAARVRSYVDALVADDQGPAPATAAVAERDHAFIDALVGAWALAVRIEAWLEAAPASPDAAPAAADVAALREILR